ncbi:DUF1217 domain-containing protein [Rhizobium sp. FKY42]|uniref:DUF1217 domain-containing protein n=1 Tax=Rhizobium sp. FKY42 TaxID=2562310 RepID=UPI0010BF98E9|nr:DUF1217 domain-containing protein [Rhizobium sp. FKY42]
MVSTFLSYDLVNRDLYTSLNRVAKQPEVSREADYYEANIAKVKTVDEFMENDRLYNYAMKAFGLGEMTYAKAFMQKVLESDLSDETSFANRLSDSRYRQFAAAFNFNNTSSAVAQTSNQMDDVIGLYSATMDAKEESVSVEAGYFNAMMGTITSVDQLLSDDRLRSYMFTAYGLDETYYSRDFLKGVLTSDTSDANSYINQNLKPSKDELTAANADLQAKVDASDDPDERISLRNQIFANEKTLSTIEQYYKLADAFQFNADGTVPTGGAQTSDQSKATYELYLSNQTRVSTTTATNEDTYFKSKIGSVTKIEDLSTDSRLYNYITKAFDLDGVVWSNIESALKSDLNDTSSAVYTLAAEKPGLLELAKAFNFASDGTVAAGSAQTAQQQETTSNYYFSRYDDTQDEADEQAALLYKTAMTDVTSVDDFLSKPNAYEFALKAVGLDPSQVSTFTLRQVLTSDLNDTKSFVYTLGDDRYLQLAKAFNFGKDGKTTSPVIAQTTATITSIGSAYTIQQTRLLKGTELTSAQTKAKEEVSYYSKQMVEIETASQFLSDSRLVNVLLTSYGVDPKDVSSDFLKQVFSSDLLDPNSFVNQQKDGVWAEILGSFNFDKSGNVSRNVNTGVQSQGKIIEIENKYNRQTLEEQQGEANPGVRLALYFERMSPKITSAYDILGDTALLEFFRVSYSLPESFSNMDVDKQAALVEKYMTLSDLKDSDKVAKMISKFTALYDQQNSSASSSALSILNGTGAASGISADLLYSLSQR